MLWWSFGAASDGWSFTCCVMLMRANQYFCTLLYSLSKWNPCCSLSLSRDPCSLRLGTPSVLATVTKTDVQQQVWPCLFGSLQTLQRNLRVCERTKTECERLFFIVTYGTVVHVSVIKTSFALWSAKIFKSASERLRIMRGKYIILLFISSRNNIFSPSTETLTLSSN